MFVVLEKGMMASVQDTKGRRGYHYLGFPPSGAMDSLALTVGNVLVGNDPDEAGIEFAFQAPKIKMLDDCLIAVTGVPVDVFIDDEQVSMWEAVFVRKNQMVTIRPKDTLGQWGYISISGGIDVPKYLGGKSTFVFSGVGGHEGRYLEPFDVIRTGEGSLDNKGLRLKGRYIPALTVPMTVELMPGYYQDYLTDDDIEMMFTTEWDIQMNSGRSGYRLSGSKFSFSEKAWNKPKEAGADPSNIFDTGYPMYAINLCGDTPIIILGESVSGGGYFCPFSIPDGARWKIGQCRIGTKLRFRYVTMEEATHLRAAYDGYLNEDHYYK